jgi:hypothetical protein
MAMLKTVDGETIRAGDTFTRMFIADAKIDDADIGPMWARHFPRIGVDVKSKTLVLALVYMIEDRARTRADGGDWPDCIPQDLRRYGVPLDQFWEISVELRFPVQLPLEWSSVW